MKTTNNDREPNKRYKTSNPPGFVQKTKTVNVPNENQDFVCLGF
jgi:hypothetical protein